MRCCRVVECVVRVVKNNEGTSEVVPEDVELPVAFTKDRTTAVLPVQHGAHWAIIVGGKDKNSFVVLDITRYGHFLPLVEAVRGNSHSKAITDFLSYTVNSFGRRRRLHC